MDFTRQKKTGKWKKDPKSNRRPDNFSYDACYNSKKKAQTIAWDTEATTDGDRHQRYTSNYYCPEHGSKQFELHEREVLNYITMVKTKELQI